ncbi:MAG: Sua5/YciO/YrdC/YwlC family protein [Cocleimonas sp.]|nr:Sua5/YciO/YrdC/YwlC family protein [Cocleimonas sp.]
MLITKTTDDLKRLFQKGGVFAYPTEAVYGLGCDPDNKKATLRLLVLKQRPISKGLILVASDFSQVKKYLKPLSDEQLALTQPSATTYIYPALDSAPKWLTGDFDSLAIRISQHPTVRELCETLDSALVSTSANLSGQMPAKTASEVAKQFDDKIDAILDGNTGNLLTPTVIRDSISGEIIRS